MRGDTRQLTRADNLQREVTANTEEETETPEKQTTTTQKPQYLGLISVGVNKPREVSRPEGTQAPSVTLAGRQE